MELAVGGRPVFAATGGRAFDPELPAVVFVHGAGMDHSVWALQTRWFAWHGHGVLAVDMPGHGRSGGAPLSTVDEMADWLLELVAASGAGKAALVGHSMGALAALAAGRDAGRVTALALAGVGAAMPVHPDLLAAAADGPAAWDMIVAWGYGTPSHFGMSRVPGLWLQGAGRSLLARGAGGVLASDLAACDAYGSAAEAARRVACPVLFVVGEDDRMTPPAAAAALAGEVADSRTVSIPGAGHMMMVERPDETLDALISGLGADAPAAGGPRRGRR